MDLQDALLFLCGLALLVVGAEALVRGGARLARTLGVPPLVVGLTVIAFGTSAPELVVSATAAWNGNTELAVANVAGSNVFNILVVLGAAALLRPLVVQAVVVQREVPVLIAVSLAALALAYNGRYGRPEGALLAAGLVAYALYSIRAARREARATRQEYTAAVPGRGTVHATKDTVLAVAGIALLALGGRLTVDGATGLAAGLGISERILGITLVAVGTSLPELATSLVAVLRRQMDLAVGNVVGSNLFNLLGVLGVSALVRPLDIPLDTLRLDFPVMVLAALALVPVMLSRHRVSRGEGAALLAAYAGYMVLLFR